MRNLALCALASTCLLAGCSSEEIMLAHSVKLVPETHTIPQSQLLDVGVDVFDPGVPNGEVAPEVKEKLVREGTFVQVRRAESMYMAVDLRDTLQNSGHWGSVWVTPQPTTAADINVKTKILQSDGDIVRLHAKAVDATGRVWLDKDYELETAEGAYDRQRYPNVDPYQDIFNEIANDLAAAQKNFSADDLKEVRRVAALRYADALSPDAFAGYVKEEKDGRYELNRLPADGDPMFDRTERVRARDRLFMDTLNEHYTKFANDAEDSYDGWRQSAREEAIAIHELQKSARWRTGLGIASILASVVYGTSGGHNAFSDRVVTDALMYMGTDMLKSAAVRRQEKKMHTDSLEEVTSSFNDNVRPLVVDIKGTQHRLTGTVDAQYQEWRDLLQRMFENETGFSPEEVKVYEAPASEDSKAAGQIDGSGTDQPGSNDLRAAAPATSTVPQPAASAQSPTSAQSSVSGRSAATSTQSSPSPQTSARPTSATQPSATQTSAPQTLAPQPSTSTPLSTPSATPTSATPTSTQAAADGAAPAGKDASSAGAPQQNPAAGTGVTADARQGKAGGA